MKKENKTAAAKVCGVSRTLLYYRHRQPGKDWKLKCDIERILRTYPSYGHKRIAPLLERNKKTVLRVMKMYGIKPYRRKRTQKYRKRKPQKQETIFENLLLKTFPQYPHHIWASDFTHIAWEGKMDISGNYSRYIHEGNYGL